MTNLFSHLDSNDIANLIRSARKFVCYAGPGVQMAPAQAMIDMAARLGVEMVTVAIDFDENVMRMGFGNIAAVNALRSVGIMVHDASGMRTALIIVDDEGYIFTPTALYLESESHNKQAANAMCLSTEQIREALARLSPAAKVIAIAQATNEQERKRITELPVEVYSEPITDKKFYLIDQSLKEAPPVQFDLARQVRVFNAYLQYVELTFTGAAIQRQRIAVPPSILKLGGSQDMKGRLHTTFDLIERSCDLSSKNLEDELNEIRKNLTPSLGKVHGRVVLKSAKPLLDERIKTFKIAMSAHKEKVENELQNQLDESRKQIVDYYIKLAIDNPPDSMRSQLQGLAPTEEKARLWLDTELIRVIPNAKDLIKKMQLDVNYKDVTFETLNDNNFIVLLTKAFPLINWESAYDEFRAAGEAD